MDKTIPMIISAICFLISLFINNLIFALLYLLLTLIFLFLEDSEEVKNGGRKRT